MTPRKRAIFSLHTVAVRVFSSAFRMPKPALVWAVFVVLSLTAFGNIKQVAASGTITQLSLDEGSGVIASDSSGNGVDGTLLGGATFTAGSGDGSPYSVQFDGNNDLIDLGPLDIEGDALTLAAWFNANQFPGGNRDPRIISKASGLGSNSHVFMLSTTKVSDNTRLRGRVRVGGVTTTVTALTGNLTTDTWYHAALTYDGSNLRLYLDGVQVGIKSLSGPVDTARSVSVAVGGQPDQTNRIWDGYLDDIRILQRALTATEVVAIADGTGAGNQLIYLSTTDNGTVSNGNGNTISYRDEDIIVYDTESNKWSLYFDASDVGITGDINAFSVNDDNSLLFSLVSPVTLSGLGNVDDSDIIRFVPDSTGENTSGTFELYFDGSDAGLSTSGEDIQALGLLDNGNIVISTVGNVSVPGVSASDSDLLEFSPTQLGSNTSGTWSLYFQGADVDLTTSGEDIWAASIDNNNIYLSTSANFSTTTVSGDSADILLCAVISTGSSTSCDYSLFWNGGNNGLQGKKLDGLEIRPTTTTPENAAPVAADDSFSTDQDSQLIISASGVLVNDSDPDNDSLTAVLASAPANGTLILNADGSATYTPNPGFSGSDSFSYRASDGQATSAIAIAEIIITEVSEISEPIYVSTNSNGIVGSTTYSDEDIIVFDTTTEQWSKFFDGSDVGITNNVNAFTISSDGSVLMSFITSTIVPDIGSVRDTDIVRFIPATTGDNTSGTFEMYFDGSDVGLSSGSEDIQALELLGSGDIVISTAGAASVPGASADDSDMLLFSPTQLGSNTSGTWSRYFDGSDVNLTTGGEDIWGLTIDGANIFLSSYTNFTINSGSGAVSGDSADIMLCAAAITGENTACSYSLFWNGGLHGLDGKIVDGIDVGASPPAGGPVIDVWYGSAQSFGQIGQPQNYINILGTVSDPDGVSAMSYRLNGGPQQGLTIGSDNKRLWNNGDFNVDIPINSLQNGGNQVVLRAIDSLGNTSSTTVTINYDGTTTWPETYQIDWSQQTSIQDAMQIVDGTWTLTADGVRSNQQAYDRLLAVGDLNWTDYELLVDFTIHSINTSPSLFPGVGAILRWSGHSDSPLSGYQPKSGWLPMGAIGWMAYFPPTAASRMQVNGYQTPRERKNFDYVFGQTYTMRLRVETVSASESTYSMKVWNTADTEPGNWDLVYDDVTSGVQSGSALLVANHADVTFGNLSIAPVSNLVGLPPTQPGPVNALVLADNHIALTWNASTDDTGNVAYRIYRGTTLVATVNTPYWIDTNTAVGSNTSYQVVAVDTDGNTSTGRNATVTNVNSVSGSWWDSDWPYRFMIGFSGEEQILTDKYFEHDVDFGLILSALDTGGTVMSSTVRCHEVTQAGVITGAEIACAYIPDSTQSNIGTLSFYAGGTTTAETARYMHIYFDLKGGNSTPATALPAVTLIDDVPDENQLSFQLTNLQSQLLYQKEAGGFSSVLDSTGADWINHSSAPGVNGQFRGIPNMVHPEGYMHPGDTGNTQSDILLESKLKATIESTTLDQKWSLQWSVFPQHAELTVLQADHDYWILYEGTPGGTFDPTTDRVTRSSGQSNTLATNWSGDLNGEEWVFFSDTVANRSLYLVKHTDDNSIDSYRSGSNKMTVFGFGRQGVNSLLDPLLTPSRFSMGFVDSVDFQTVRSTIDSLLAPVTSKQSRAVAMP